MDTDLKEFLAELASVSPAPGGGSVAALAGALASALVAMVGRLTVGHASQVEKEEMGQVIEAATRLTESLNQHVAKDMRAFNQVMQAYRLPRQTQEEKQIRSGAIQEALKGAANHPLRVAEECLEVLRLCRKAVTVGNPNTLSDAGVAALMAYAGTGGAMLNIAINLEAITDHEFVRRTVAEKDRIMVETAGLYEGIRELLQDRLTYVTGW